MGTTDSNAARHRCRSNVERGLNGWIRQFNHLRFPPSGSLANPVGSIAAVPVARRGVIYAISAYCQA